MQLYANPNPGTIVCSMLAACAAPQRRVPPQRCSNANISHTYAVDSKNAQAVELDLRQRFVAQHLHVRLGSVLSVSEDVANPPMRSADGPQMKALNLSPSCVTVPNAFGTTTLRVEYAVGGGSVVVFGIAGSHGASTHQRPSGVRIMVNANAPNSATDVRAVIDANTDAFHAAMRKAHIAETDFSVGQESYET
jgi:hypothetical protein